MKTLISNIQRFSLNDGEGIRTTIFFKGCWLRCPWCSNPENIQFEQEMYTRNGKTEYFGYELSLHELEQVILKDVIFYGKEGGVTYSGGEPLLHMHQIIPLLISLHKKGVNQCIETSLYAPKENLEIACQYIDEFIVDAKILIKENAKRIIGGDLSIYQNNMQRLVEQHKPITLRIPLVNPYTINDENLYEIRNLIEEYSISKVEIFKVHSLGKKKYLLLGREQDIGVDIGNQELEKIIEYLGKERVELISL